MSMRYFMPKRLRPADLECLGVKIKPAQGPSTAYVDKETGHVLCEVGDVTIHRNGRVFVWPREDIDDLRSAMPAMLTSAEDAAMGRRKRDCGWQNRKSPSGAYWRCTVYVSLPDSHKLSMALRRGRFVETDNRAGLNRRAREAVQ